MPGEAPNLLLVDAGRDPRDFSAGVPGERLVTDITEFRLGGEGPGPTCRRWSTSTTGAWWPGGAGPPLGGARDGHARGRGRGSGSASGRASPARCPGGATRPTTPPWRASSEGSRWRCSGAVTGRGGPPTPSPASWPPTSAGATPRGSGRSARAAAPYGTRQTGGGAASARRPELCKVQERVRAPK